MIKPERSNYRGMEPDTAPTTCWKRMWWLLKTSWSELVCLNLLTISCCVPVVTIPAALLAQHRVVIFLCGDDGNSLGKLYVQEFKHAIPASFVLDLLLFPMLLMILVLGGCSSLFTQSVSGMVLLLLMIIAVVWSWMVYSYAFVMKAAMELRWRDVLTNSLLLSIIEFRNNLRLLLPLLLLAAGVFFLPYTCVLFLLCLPSLCAALTSCMVYPILVKRIKVDEFSHEQTSA